MDLVYLEELLSLLRSQGVQHYKDELVELQLEAPMPSRAEYSEPIEPEPRGVAEFSMLYPDGVDPDFSGNQ